MQHVRAACFDEFAAWYLERERREKGSDEPPSTPGARLHAMQQFHPGKMLPWFATGARWTVGLITELAELSNLVILRSEWTQREGFPRFLYAAAHDALQTGYFRTAAERRGRHQAYYRRLSNGTLRLRGDNRIVVRAAFDNERAEARVDGAQDPRLYLHDGIGRLLPYLSLVLENRLPFEPIEAFLPIDVSCDPPWMGECRGD